MDPLLDAASRTVKVRLSFANPKGELRPEMFGEVTLRGASREAPRVPLDAIIDSGTEKIVFVALGDGKFQPRIVAIGQTDGSFAEVIEGVSAGDRVVTRANFLVDSESRLRASLAEMSAPTGAGHAPESARVLPSTSPPPAASSRASPPAPRPSAPTPKPGPSGTPKQEQPAPKAPEHSGHQH
jgi:Cu(I)/Ag(I) efflux system membrane fusion protein